MFSSIYYAFFLCYFPMTTAQVRIPRRTDSCRRSLFALCVVCAMFFASAAQAQITTTIGAGTESCGKWLAESSRVAARAAREQWVYGFITGINRQSPANQSRPVDGDAVSAYIDLYCKNNPLHSLFQASLALIEETGGPKAAHQWSR
jgi:hypothetical protein